MVLHLENHYVCILNSEVLPNADTPLAWTGKGEHAHNDVSWQFQAEVALPLKRVHTASRQLFETTFGEP